MRDWEIEKVVHWVCTYCKFFRKIIILRDRKSSHDPQTLFNYLGSNISDKCSQCINLTNLVIAEKTIESWVLALKCHHSNPDSLNDLTNFLDHKLQVEKGVKYVKSRGFVEKLLKRN